MPPTPRATTSESEQTLAIPAEETKLSKQAQFSSYKPDPDVDDDQNPPDGPHVIQELGKPSEGAVKAFGES